MRRLALLLTGGAVWLFLAAIPVLADGGPHISTINSGTAGINRSEEHTSELQSH